MKFQSFRSAVVVASVIVGSVIPSQAFAETDVLTTGATVFFQGTITSTYTFQSSMILNSIGFLDHFGNATAGGYYYSINGGGYTQVEPNNPNLLARDANNVRWITLDQSVTNGTILRLKTDGSYGAYAPASANSGTNVQFNGTVIGSGSTNLTISSSNIRVTNPGSNVAPEPGTLALALTGGCALVGIYIRRRRMSN